MNRNYIDGKANDVKLFTGVEIENTPARGLKTLFVVGIQDVNLIQSTSEGLGIQHIYFGANHSFMHIRTNDQWQAWCDMMRPFLDNDKLWITLDFDISISESVLEEAWVEYNNFIPIISCKIPYISQFGYNACIKIDDKDFAATNNGVWVHSIHSLTARDKFTHWAEYTKDLPLE